MKLNNKNNINTIKYVKYMQSSSFCDEVIEAIEENSTRKILKLLEQSRAQSNHDMSIVKYMSNNNTNICFKKCPWMILMRLCIGGNIHKYTKIVNLVNTYGSLCNPGLANNEGETPLMWLCFRKSKDASIFLLDTFGTGCNLEQKENEIIRNYCSTAHDYSCRDNSNEYMKPVTDKIDSVKKDGICPSFVKGIITEIICKCDKCQLQVLKMEKITQIYIGTYLAEVISIYL